MKTAFCVIGTVLLIAAPVTCLVTHRKEWLWMSMLIAGELFAWMGILLL